jgi:hypothetical protein
MLKSKRNHRLGSCRKIYYTILKWAHNSGHENFYVAYHLGNGISTKSVHAATQMFFETVKIYTCVGNPVFGATLQSCNWFSEIVGIGEFYLLLTYFTHTYSVT